MLRLLRSNSTSSIRRLSSPRHPLKSCSASPQILVPKSSMVSPTPPRISSPRAFSSSVKQLNTASQSVILLESLNLIDPVPNSTHSTVNPIDDQSTEFVDDGSQSTGFMVKGKYALCSCHGLFIPKYLPRPEMVDLKVQVDILVSFWDGTFTTAKVLGLDPAADLAVLELQHVPVTVRPLEPSVIRPRVLQSCFSLGYYDFTFTIDDGFVVSPSVPITFFSKSNSVVFSHREYVSKDFYAIMTQMVIGGVGKSGGPVVDEDQRVMGVLVGVAEKSMLGFVTPIEYGMRLLEYVLEKNHDRTILVNHVDLF